MGTRSSPRPISRQRSAASGRRPRNPSGPTSTLARPNGSRPELAPEPVARLEHHHAGGGGVGPAGAAAQLPGGGQPGDPPAHHGDGRPGRAGRHRGVSHRRPPPHHAGQDREEGRVVVERGRAGEGEARLLGRRPGLDVEVVEDLEVVGDEADRADAPRRRPRARRARRSPTSRSGPSHGSGVRPALCHATRQGTARPSRPAAAATADGRGGHLVGVGVALGDHPLGEGVGGEEDRRVPCAARQGREGVAQPPGQEVGEPRRRPTTGRPG